MGSLLVTDSALNAVLRINPGTGNRTIISDASVGAGPLFETPTGLAFEVDANILVTDSTLKALIRVTLENGDRTVVSGGDTMGN